MVVSPFMPSGITDNQFIKMVEMTARFYSLNFGVQKIVLRIYRLFARKVSQ